MEEVTACLMREQEPEGYMPSGFPHNTNECEPLLV